MLKWNTTISILLSKKTSTDVFVKCRTQFRREVLFFDKCLFTPFIVNNTPNYYLFIFILFYLLHQAWMWISLSRIFWRILVAKNQFRHHFHLTKSGWFYFQRFQKLYSAVWFHFILRKQIQLIKWHCYAVWMCLHLFGAWYESLAIRKWFNITKWDFSLLTSNTFAIETTHMHETSWNIDCTPFGMLCRREISTICWHSFSVLQCLLYYLRQLIFHECQIKVYCTNECG